LAKVIVAVIFGSLLGRVTLDTGIAKTIVNFAAEYGGENPFALSLVLSLVVALLFTSLSGLGAIIMVGSVVLPIMMTTGVPRKLAATMFLMAFALGFIFNIANWKFYTTTFGVTEQQMIRYAIVLAAVDLVALVAYASISFARTRDYATWAVRAKREPERGVPWYALIAPVLPILLYYALHVDPIVALLLSAIYGALAARPAAFIPTIVAAAIRGIEDVAPAIVLFLGIGMLAAATKEPQFAAALSPLAHSALVRNPVFYVVLFGLLSPLVLYRGPLNPFGVGIAVFVVLLASNTIPPVVLVAAIMAVVQVQNVCDPTNTANVWVANFTGIPIDEITKRTLPYQVAVATAGALIVVLAAPALFGLHPFSSAIAAASAAELPAILAPARSANRIAVGSDGSPTARAAVRPVIDALRGWNGINAFMVQSDPNSSGCAEKTYVAYVTVTSATFALSGGTDVDVGLQLADCGGWPITEWHDHRVLADANDTRQIAALARSGVERLKQWIRDNPERGGNLLRRGLAFAAGDPPTYYYTLFKTVDGNMRAFVRAGGPAYAAGMRSNDIVNKLDGLYWWEYGTYQTQRRAYDGKAHTFELQRGTQTLDVALGEPFTGRDL
ncbi:MAG: hypothetical protein JO165_08360, partial [Candidatus Eremiobacteraeota bacterium]|nr:hypothetical protein [Candidatus Eremiobacteraeota bacterium]